jgi:hypothetical protein
MFTPLINVLTSRKIIPVCSTSSSVAVVVDVLQCTAPKVALQTALPMSTKAVTLIN